MATLEALARLKDSVLGDLQVERPVLSEQEMLTYFKLIPQVWMVFSLEGGVFLLLYLISFAFSFLFFLY